MTRISPHFSSFMTRIVVRFRSHMDRTYIWERPEWPALTYRASEVLAPLAEARKLQGELLGSMAHAGFEEVRHAQLDTFVIDALDTSKIEGENLDPDSVRSSVARRLGIEDAGGRPRSPMAEGVVELTLDATRNFALPLTQERLFNWHSMLLSGSNDAGHLTIGTWRDDATGRMTVSSGPAGRRRIHYVAPPAAGVPAEMERFLHWFAQPPSDLDGLLRAGLAHFWFVTVHPFDDGNGRIGRAVSDLALAQDEQLGTRFYSVTKQIWLKRKSYYEILERTSIGDLDVTDWLLWFLARYSDAIRDANAVVGDVRTARRFWQRHSGTDISPRQRLVLDRVLRGFDGKLTVKKYAALAKISVSSASRDVNDLVEKRVLGQNEGGSKNTSYRLVGVPPSALV